ncbi:MAG: DEAD/DEAH box helicase [Asgard group archaeon]|nr:DEAD/DEAH box helicase [Asgard group archaeon]
MNESNFTLYDLTDFQERCLEEFEAGKDVLAIAPSSAGKTFITEQYILDYFQQNYGKFLVSPRRMKVAFVLPYKSLAIQEFNYFSTLVDQRGIKLLLAVGGVDINEEELADANIIIGTYEKILVLFKRHQILRKYIKILVVDEFHFLGTDRGTVLEEIILEWIKIRNKTQLILLSSSVSNPLEISDWLNVVPVIATKRPIPISYSVEVSSNFKQFIKQLKSTGKQIMVFCHSRSEAENLADKLSKEFPKKMETQIDQIIYSSLANIDDDKVRETIQNAFFPPLLKDTTQRGVAYHHAGLSGIVRLLIENLFLQNELDILVSTSTLAAGINLPADIAVYTIKHKKIDAENNLVFQTLGRAGRLGFRSKGEGLVVVTNERMKVKTEKRLFEDEGGNFRPIFHSIESKLGDYDFLIKFYLESLHYSEKTYSSNLAHLIEPINDSFWFYQNKTKLMRHLMDYEILQAFFSSTESNLNPEEIIDFYQRFDKTRKIKKTRMEIQSIEGLNKAAIVANIREQSRLFQIYLSPSRRSCTCQSKHSNFICKHQRYLLKEYPEAQERWLSTYGIFDFLIKEGFIVKSAGENFNLTYMGQITAQYFIHPYDFLDYLEFCGTNKNITISQYLKQFITRDKKIKQEIKANELSSLQAIKLAQSIVNGDNVKQMCERYNVSDSFIDDWKETIYRFMRMFQSIHYFTGNKDEAERIVKWIENSIAFREKDIVKLKGEEMSMSST